jgi:hypothetical protein
MEQPQYLCYSFELPTTFSFWYGIARIFQAEEIYSSPGTSDTWMLDMKVFFDEDAC